MTEDEGLSEAVDELNQRLIRANRRRSKLTLALAVIAGLAAATAVVTTADFTPGVGVFGWLAAVFVVGMAFAAAVCTFVLSDLLTRGLGRRLEQRWLGQLAQQKKVDRQALAEMILPLGGQHVPAGTKARIHRNRRALLLGVLSLGTVVAILVALGLAPLLLIILPVVFLVSAAAIMHWYLGYRPPR